MAKRIHNFNAGPAALPLAVLEEINRELISYKGEGLSVMEMSHRSKTFDGIIKNAEALAKKVLGIPSGYRIIFMQGGATLQFANVPLNLLPADQSADYVLTGAWSKKALAEAQKLHKNVNVVASSEDKNFSYIPESFEMHSDATYVHLTSNNTIFGSQWQEFPDTGDIPLICDMSSDIACRKIDISKFSLIYAGAQKNLGPSGVTMVIIRDELMERSPADIPTMTSYKIIGGKESLYNTPPTFAIYIMERVFQWILNSGGLEEVEKINRKKADVLYGMIDSTDFYTGTVDVDSRSLMNIPFRLPSEELEKKFIEASLANSMLGLKGHRSVGGIRASTYNAVPLESVEALVSFMKEFERKNG